MDIIMSPKSKRTSFIFRNYPELNELTTGPTTRKTLIKTEEERVSTDAFYLTAPFNLERDDNSEVKLRVNHDIYSNNQNQ